MGILVVMRFVSGAVDWHELEFETRIGNGNIGGIQAGAECIARRVCLCASVARCSRRASVAHRRRRAFLNELSPLALSDCCRLR